MVVVEFLQSDHELPAASFRVSPKTIMISLKAVAFDCRDSGGQPEYGITAAPPRQACGNGGKVHHARQAASEEP
jgi:hypothetical protein